MLIPREQRSPWPKVFFVGLLLGGVAAYAVARPASVQDTIYKLNGAAGSPTMVTATTTTGTAVIIPGTSYLVSCLAAAWVRPAATVTATGAGMGIPLAALEKYYFLNDSSATLAVITASGTAECGIWPLQ